MKTFISILFLIVALQANGQVFLGGAIDDYVGTWKYENPDSNEVFTIKLKKTIITTDNENFDCIIGTYSYTKNGTIIEDNMPQFSSITNPYKAPICAKSYSNDFSSLFLYFVDYKFKKDTGSGKLSLILTRGGKYQLQWMLEEDEGAEIYLPDEEIPPYIPGWSVPENVVLVKVE